MNAYELADELETRIATQGFEITKQSATMLRQQADRIAELEKDLEEHEIEIDALIKRIGDLIG